MLRAILIGSALMSLAACETLPPALTGSTTTRAAPAAATPAAYEPTAEQQLLDLERRLAAQSQAQGIGQALGGALDATDGFVLRPGEVLTGADAVQQGLSSSGPVFWQPDKVFVSSAGDMGVTSGRYVEVTAGSEALQGRYLAVWRKDANGEWRLLSATRVADPPAARRRR
ncbi:MAG TPA: nuclear transport factor 2 family protein [Caulobacterales bacterium]|nr:nuclear transport factor 2 family protein [Caulobacterales bacterium]